MPFYDYDCRSCGGRFELRQGFDASPEQPCPTCGAQARRRIHAPPVIFKGSGWYVNDYGRKGAAADGAKAEDAGSNGAPSEGAAKDTSDNGHGHTHGAGQGHDEANGGSEAKPAATPAATPAPKSDSKGAAS